MELPRASRKSLSVFGLAMMNVIAVDSIRNLPVSAAMGVSLTFYYLAATLLFLIPCLLITAELATHYPKTGGVYIWTRQAFGPRFGFVTIFWLWVYNLVWFPTILSFIVETVLSAYFPSLAHHQGLMIGIILSVFGAATLLNAFGVRTLSVLSMLGAILGTILPMALLIFLAATWYFQGRSLAVSLNWQEFFPHTDNLNHLATLSVIVFSLMGLELSAVHAAEVQEPKKNFPKALAWSALLIVLSQILASLALCVLISPKDLGVISGIAQAFQILLTTFKVTWLMPILILMITLGAFAGMSAWVLGPARAFGVAARDAKMPKWLLAETRKGAPIGILIAQAVIVAALSSLFALGSMTTVYWMLSVLSAQLALLYYILFFAAGIKLRYITAPEPKAFRIPGGHRGVWLVGLIGILTCLVSIATGFVPPSSGTLLQTGTYEILLCSGIFLFIALPFLIYQFSARSR